MAESNQCYFFLFDAVIAPHFANRTGQMILCGLLPFFFVNHTGLMQVEFLVHWRIQNWPSARLCQLRQEHKVKLQAFTTNIFANHLHVILKNQVVISQVISQNMCIGTSREFEKVKRSYDVYIGLLGH